jgi:transcription antitermination factor NusG
MKDSEKVKWYPMRSTYSRELKVKENLVQLGVECYVPMTYRVLERDGERHRLLVPAIHNLIFVHASKDAIKVLKENNPLFSSLRFIMRKSLHEKDAESETLIIPTSQMNNFILATRNHEAEVTYLKDGNVSLKHGQKVRVVDGNFMGVEGEIIRIRKNKRVTIRVEGLSTVMLNFVPNQCLEIDAGKMMALPV